MLSPVEKRIVEILAPHIPTVEARRALFSSAFGTNHELLNQIDFDGSADEFSWGLLPVLIRFGEINLGRSAIQRLLEVIRERVGIDEKERIELLLQELGVSSKPQPNCIFVGFAPDDAALGTRIVDELSSIYSDVEVYAKEDMEWDGDEPIYCAVVILSSPSKALVAKEVKHLIRGQKQIVTVLTPDTDRSTIPINLNGTPTILLEDDLRNLHELTHAVGEIIDMVRGLRKEWWEILVSKIESFDCVPIVGPDMCGEPIISESTIAFDWASKFGYALSGDVDISRVAQYLAYMESGNFNFKQDLSMQRLFSTRPAFIEDKNNQYRLLASLPFKLFVNTSADNFLFEALIESEKEPEEWHFWNEAWLEEHRDELETKFDDLTKDTPAIVYLFGHHSSPESMRISEDEFLDYLVRSGRNLRRNPPLFPAWLANVLSNKMLLILGFQLHDWRFRTITHAFKDYFVSENSGFSHLAVQIPTLRDAASSDDEEKVKAYIEKYLSRINSHVFVGNPISFLSQLKHKWEPRSS